MQDNTLDQAEFYQGDTWPITGRLHDGKGKPLNLRGVASITWVLADISGNPLITLAFGVDITVTDELRGYVAIVAPSSQTSSLVPGLYRHQLQCVVNGVPSTQWEGTIKVKARF